MNHSRAAELLPDLVAGVVIGDDVRSELITHFERCEQCAADAAVYDVLVGSLGESGGAQHLSSDVIARLAVGEVELESAAEAHLDSCPVCRRDLELLQFAVERSRESRPGERELSKSASLPSRRPARRFALAASVLLAVVVVGGVGLELSGVSDEEQVLSDVSGRSLSGKQVISSPGQIMASSVHIEQGSSIRFQAQDAVVLGDDFAVGNDADLAIEVGTEK